MTHGHGNIRQKNENKTVAKYNRQTVETDKNTQIKDRLLRKMTLEMTLNTPATHCSTCIIICVRVGL
jgi:aldehyde:ferredoxin oxidoreductase